MFDQAPFAIPVRILRDPGIPASLQNLFFVLLGFFLGLLADQLKLWLSLRSELKLAKKEIYDELASYIADVEMLRSPEIDFSTYKHIRTTAPRLDVIDWYQKNRFDLILRLDKRKGIRLLYDELRSLSDRTDSSGAIGSQEHMLDLVQDHEHALDGAYLRERIKMAHERAPKRLPNS